jgi:hypothetical protein
MYVEIRLLTLISNALRPTKVETSEIQTFLEEQRLGKRTIIWARKLRTISSKQKGELTRLANLRNDIAHQRKTWIMKPDRATRRDMEEACKNAIQFLKDTVGDPR